MFRILVVEDDPDLGRLFVKVLERAGYTAILSPSGEDALQKIEDEKVDLMLTDVMMPGMDGFTLTREARDLIPGVPVMVITARSAFLDKQAGFASGADDYIAKPFGTMELISRIKALLRRSAPSSATTADILTIGRLSLNQDKHEVIADGGRISLTLKEYDMLCLLMKNNGRVFTRDELLSRIWGYDFSGESRTVDVHIRTLRSKLGTCGELIETIRGVGYKIGEKND